MPFHQTLNASQWFQRRRRRKMAQHCFFVQEFVHRFLWSLLDFRAPKFWVSSWTAEQPAALQHKREREREREREGEREKERERDAELKVRSLALFSFSLSHGCFTVQVKQEINQCSIMYMVFNNKHILKKHMYIGLMVSVYTCITWLWTVKIL